MKYRTLGRTGLSVSEIGMGLEHLLPKEQSVVTETIRAAIKGGVNYLDCLSQKDFAENSSENDQFAKLGKALEGGLREKVCINYLANANRSEKDDFIDGIKTGFECFLRELKTDSADIFIIAFCDKAAEYERIYEKGGLFEYAEKLRDEKKIRFIGISTHSVKIARKAIESGGFDALMYPINPAFDAVTDEEKYIAEDLGKLWDAAYNYKADESKETKLVRKDIYAECKKYNIGLVAMKPFGGGFLFREDINAAGFTPINLISYVLAQTGVSCVVPGCTSPGQIEEILGYYTCPKEKSDFSGAVRGSRWNIAGACQYCNHCLPCAAGIDIGQVNRIIDGRAALEYDSLDVKASSCVKCGECEKRCPFGVKAMKKMDLAAQMFERK
jgi:predicted aldo/keto reductase-like oxidoreductase